MKIKEGADVYFEFKCSKYLTLSGIPYKLCIGRQLAKKPGGDFLYSECAECVEGKDVIKRFGDYTPPKKNKIHMVDLDEERKAKVLTTVDCVKCKTLLQGQIEYAIQLILQERKVKAIERLELLSAEIGGI